MKVKYILLYFIANDVKIIFLFQSTNNNILNK